MLVPHFGTVSVHPFEPPTVDDTFDACELIALESYSPGRTAPNVCAQDVAVNLGDGVWCGWNGESPERGPKQRDRWKVSAHLITAGSVDGIADDDREAASRSTVEEEIETHAVWWRDPRGPFAARAECLIGVLPSKYEALVAWSQFGAREDGWSWRPSERAGARCASEREQQDDCHRHGPARRPDTPITSHRTLTERIRSPCTSASSTAKPSVTCPNVV